MPSAVWYAASRVTSVRHGRRPVNPCPMRARMRAMPSSVMRAPCPATSAMSAPLSGRTTGRDGARAEQAKDRLLEKPPLHLERGGFDGIGAPGIEPPEATGVDEVREHQPEQPEGQMRHLVALPPRAGRGATDDRHALAVERRQPARDQVLDGAGLLEEGALHETAEVRMLRQVRNQGVD